MKARDRALRGAQLHLRLQRATREVEGIVSALRTALAEGAELRVIEPAARSLQRAAAAALAVVAGAGPGGIPDEVRAVLDGTSPVFSFLGSRLVLAGHGGAAPPRPSVGARALALLLEEPGRALGAAEVSRRLGCSIPVARTALHRLVRSGHAARPAAGLFQARPR
ncbi:MAG TPA: hypothetical protein VMU15_05770 [Anaeromyxobacter sp.]|nr:hypothetical protein [Anaeromyxobacter sp.]